MVNAIFALPSIRELANISLLLLSSYCTLLCTDFNVMDRMLVFCYEKMTDPSLQNAAVDLFRSVCKEGSQLILQNPEFASKNKKSE